MRNSAWTLSSAQVVEELQCRKLDLEQEFELLIRDNRPAEEWMPVFEDWERVCAQLSSLR